MQNSLIKSQTEALNKCDFSQLSPGLWGLLGEVPWILFFNLNAIIHGLRTS